MKLKKIFASAFAAVAAITSVASLTSCKKDDVTDDGGNENDATAEIQAKLDAAIKGLSVKSSYDADFTLPTTAAGGVTISWASNNDAVVKIENGKATITRPGLTEADATVKITATAVIDGETKTKEFTITIPHVADQSITIAEIKALESGTKTAAKGIVTGFAYNEKDTETQSNVNVRSGFYLTDDTGTIYVFGKNVAAELSIGDEVYLNAEKSIYYGAHQLSYPADVVKLGENKTATFNNVITDKTVTELATAAKPGDNETTNQGNVYELLAYFEKAGGSSYVNYRVVDPYNTSNYLNVYFTGTIVPGETYEFTEKLDAYAGKFCKVTFYMSGTNSSGKWRGHVLDFEDLTEAESAKMLLVQATSDIPAVVPVVTPTAEITLPEIELPTGTTLAVTSTCTNVSYADGKITITKPETDTTAEIKFAVMLGETVVAEYTKTVELKVTATDITSLVTIEDGVVSIPYTAIKYAGEHIIDLGDGKKITINIGAYTDLSTYKEFGLDKSGVITITTKDIKLDALIADAYYKDYNMECYAGIDATGTKITGTKGKDDGDTYTYAFETATNNVYYVNTSTEKYVGFYDIQLVLEGSLDELKAKEEANRLAGLIDDLYESTTNIDLSSTLGTVVITPQAGATTLTVNGTTLTVTPGATEVTETITIKVTIGDAEFTTEAINIKSKEVPVTEGNFSATLGNPESSISSDNVNETTDYAANLGLKDNLFNVSCAKNNGTTMTYLQYTETRLYWDNSQNGNGSTIKVAVEEMAGYTLSISSIVVKYSSADYIGGTVTANGNVITGTANELEYTYELNGATEFVIQNTNTTNVQVRFKSIVINYTVTEKEPVEYTVDLTKTEFNLKNDATMPTVEYDVYASVWGGTEPTGTFIPVSADGKFEVVGTFTGVTLLLIKKDQTPAWEGDNFLAQTIDYTVDGTTIVVPFDGTEDYTEYALDLSKIQYNLSTETTLPAEYDVYVTVWGGTEPTGGLVQVDAEGKFKVLGTFTNATLLLIVKGETPAWEGEAFIAKTKEYTLTETTIAGPFDGTEVATEYTVDLEATQYNLKNGASMPTVEYDVYATVWGGTATSGTFIPVAADGKFEVFGTFTGASLLLIAKDQTPAWSGDNFLAQTTDYSVSENTLVAPIGSPVTHAEYLATETGENITVKGTIIAFKSNKKEIYIQDTDGAYYLYFASKVESDWLVTGNTIVVNGTRGVRYSAQYIDNCSFVEKLDGEDVIEVTALDKTTDFTNDGFTNLSTSDEQRLVTFTGEWLGNNKVKVGEQTINLYFYCTAPTLVQNARYSFTGLLGFYDSNSNITYQVQIFDANLVVDMRTDEEKAEDELDRLVALLAETYNQTTEIDLSSTVGTVVVTPQSGATTLAVDGTKLTVTPGATEVTETLTISVTVGEQTKTSDTISIKTVNSRVGTYSETLASDGSQDYVASDSTSDYAETLGLSSLFSVTFAANSCTNGSGIARFHTTNYLQMYGASDSQGTSLTVSINELSGYVVTITSVDITYASVNSVAIDGNAVEVDTTAKTSSTSLNTTTGFTFQNTHTSQVKVKSIVINYTITEANA